tara:strand:- start:2753 stop:3448 length:696 start_codon:yes stop_codon:yes gene_type:complete
MIGSFGRKHKSHGKNYGKKDTSKFKKGLLAGGMLLAIGSGIYASKGDKETHQEVEYPTIASEEGGGLGHQAAQVERQQLVGQKVGETAAPPPAIDLEQAQAALAPPAGKKEKVAAGLKLAGDVVAGDVGKVGAVKKGIDIARGEGEALSTKSLQDQIKQAEKASKGSSLSQIGSALGLTKGNKISRESVGVGAAPMIGPVAPPEFFDDQKPKGGRFAKLNPKNISFGRGKR